MMFMAGMTLAPAHGGAIEPYPGPMRAEVVRVIDADTIRVRVKVWPTVEILATVRLRGVDTPEKGRRASCARERALAATATRHVRELLPPGRVVLIRNVRLGKYAGRVLADVAFKDVAGRWKDLARTLIRQRLGRPYGGGHRGSWCERDR